MKKAGKAEEKLRQLREAKAAGKEKEKKEKEPEAVVLPTTEAKAEEAEVNTQPPAQEGKAASGQEEAPKEKKRKGRKPGPPKPPKEKRWRAQFHFNTIGDEDPGEAAKKFMAEASVAEKVRDLVRIRRRKPHRDNRPEGWNKDSKN